jgi:Tfp pilus assembly protein PilF
MRTALIARWGSVAVGIVINVLGWIFLPPRVQAQVPVAAPPWLTPIMAKDGESKEFASGIIVSPDGLVVTDWHTLTGADTVRVGVKDVGIFDANEVVAASRGKSLVVLKLKGAPAGLQTAPLGDDLPQPGDRLTITCVANAAKLLVAEIPGPLNRTISGEQMVESLASARPTGLGLDRDVVWMRIEAVYGPLQRGGAVGQAVNGQPQVVGLVVTSPNEKDSLTNAVHAWHIKELLKNPLPAPLPLNHLNKHVDQPWEQRLPTPASWTISDTLWERGLPLADRIGKHQMRVQTIAAALADADDSDARLRKEVAPLRTNMRKLETRAEAIKKKIDSIKPEGRVPAAAYTRPATDQEKRGKGNNKVDSKGNVNDTIPGFVAYPPGALEFARELIFEYNTLANEWQILHRQLQPLLTEQAIVNYERDLRENMTRRLPQHVWQLADAAGHHPVAEHQAAIPLYISGTNDKGLTGAQLIARSWSKLHSGDLPGAELDLREAAKWPGMKNVGSASFARLMFRQGKTEAAAELLIRAEALAKGDAVALQVLGLLACEQGKFALARERFEQSLPAPGDPTESHRLLALVCATASEPQVRDAAVALRHARIACESTHGRDPYALLALAAAEAEGGRFVEAEKCAREAEAIAVPEVAARCQDWRQRFAKQQAVRDVWPVPAMVKP